MKAVNVQSTRIESALPRSPVTAGAEVALQNRTGARNPNSRAPLGRSPAWRRHCLVCIWTGGNVVFAGTAMSSRLASVGLAPTGAQTDSYPQRSESPPFFPRPPLCGGRGKKGGGKWAGSAVAARRGFRRDKPDGGHMEAALSRPHGSGAAFCLSRGDMGNGTIVRQPNSGSRTQNTAMGAAATITLDEYDRLIACGAFAGRHAQQIELIQGELFPHAPLSVTDLFRCLEA